MNIQPTTYLFFIGDSEVRVSEVRKDNTSHAYWYIDEICHSRIAAFAIGIGVPLEWVDEHGYFESTLGPSHSCEI